MMKSAPGILWIAILGGIGFSVGFFGPIVFSPEANQGPLLGIFITGPLAAFAGGVFFGFAYIFKLSLLYQWRLLFIAGAFTFLITLYFAFPGPQLKGRIFVGQVTKCQPVRETSEEIVSDWRKRISEVTWAQPRQGWEAQMQTLVQAAPGIVIKVLVGRRVSLRAAGKPWNKGKIQKEESAPFNEIKTFYFADKSCEEFPVGFEIQTYENYDTKSIQPPKEWPPGELKRVLKTSEFNPVPTDY